MLFNSIEFLFFFLIAFTIYWLIPSNKIKAQNLFILFISYLFYGFWDWRFLSLIALSSGIDFFIGKKLYYANSQKKRKRLLISSLLINLGLFSVFKYFNFFIASFSDFLSFFGFHTSPYFLSLILPLGISFYTFQTLSYPIDIYRGKITPTKNWIDFFAFVSFFPQLVAGPIEKATNLLPQFQQERKFDYFLAIDGTKQILWGLFKKIAIADTAAIHVNFIFTNYATLSTPDLLIGSILFAFQIYGDFSGYSDIAIGIGKLFGFNLMQNFSFPYFSRDIAEFWRRWHISLTNWFKDYLYIPLGGSKRNTFISCRNIFIVFLISGFWHGANWTFIAWGSLNAFLFLPLFLFKKNRKNLNIVASQSIFPNFFEFIQIISTFCLVSFTWIFFRSPSILEAFKYLEFLFTSSVPLNNFSKYIEILIVIIFLIIIEWINRKKTHGLAINWNRFISWPLYLIIILQIIYFYQMGTPNEFIYFQF